MENILIRNLIPLFPEFMVLATAIGLLMAGVLTKYLRVRFFTKTVIMLLTAVLFTLLQKWGHTVQIFDGQLIFDNFGLCVKIIILIATILTLCLLHGLVLTNPWISFEVIVLMLFAVLGMMLLVSAHNLLSFYMALELMSLSLYILASIHRDSLLSSEAGLKYFVLGALASGLFLFGCALVYGFSGTADFSKLAMLYNVPDKMPVAVLLGVVFILVALFFKISAAPFHMWTPDVYQGAPTIVTAFFSAAPKITGVAVLMRFLMEPLQGVTMQWQQIVVVVSVTSMLVGAVAALRQTNIKRLLAYSSIGHVGYLLVGVASGNITGTQSILVYGFIYILMTIGMFGIVLHLKRKKENVESLSDFAGLAKTEPLLAAIVSIFMLSMAGIPPFAGFFAKFYVFLAAMEEELYVLAVIGVVSSVIGAFYYLRIIKLMYFDDAKAPLDTVLLPYAHKLVIYGSALFTLVYFIYPSPVIQISRAAARSLLQ